MRYRNKYAIVTGASSGIGRKIAVTLTNADSMPLLLEKRIYLKRSIVCW